MTTILIVEDEKSIAENLCYALETEHFSPHHVTTGAEALSTLTSHAVDLVVLDIGLPDMTGFDVCRKIREFSSVPVLFLSARDSETDRVLALEFGGDDYVTKPFSPRELTARIRAILRRTSQSNTEQTLRELPNPEPPTAKADQLLFHDEQSMDVLSLGHSLQLTAYEYRLMKYFLAHAKRTFTRDQLLTGAWNDPGSAMDRTIDAHIKSLRAKLKKASPRLANCIVTRRGIGYMFQPPEQL